MAPPTPTQNAIAVPGQPLASSTQYLPGAGVHHRHDSILTATIPGTIHIDNTTRPLPTLSLFSPFASTTTTTAPAPQDAAPSSSSKASSSQPPQSTTTTATTITTTSPLLLLPTVGSTILGRITRTNPRQAGVDIFALYPASTNTATTTASQLPPPLTLPTPFHATLRTQDIRATEKDRVKMASSYKPGDIIRATVIGLGDQQGGYLLSTGGNVLGVVVAWREDGISGGGEGWGELLVPKSWKEMMGERMGVVEERKVARPV
ncbi:exosome component EXOSC1/CSL4-domain-containing protein [Peziza echinospora]|nr:exosome component EXOSC1/CSL4-domain-containing protein [Peziza echinospora]